MWPVEPVRAEDEPRAVSLIVGAGRGGRDVDEAAASLRSYLATLGPGRHVAWWALNEGRPVAAAMLLPAPGRTGAVLHSSADLGLVPPAALAAVLRALAEQSLGLDVVLVQSLLMPHAAGDIGAYESAGYSRLAELIYMSLALRRRRPPPSAEPPGTQFVAYDQSTHAVFAQAIQATYENSLDCPALEGLRGIEDVIAGHKAAGVFRPDLWTVALCEGRPAGVILLNPSAMSNTLEVVYMGVAAAMRGRGLGRALLARAAELGRRETFDSLTLAVDSNNPYAHRLYEAAGFVETMRRLAYICAFGRP